MTDLQPDRTAAAIEVRDLHKSFGANEVLKGIDFHVDNGQVVCVIGPSGSGKSTLLRCVNRLEEPTSGKILVEGVEITDPDVDVDEVRSRIGMVFQQFNLFPHLTVLRNLTIAQQRVQGRSKDEAGEIARRNLAKVGLAEQGGRLPGAPVRRPAAAGRDRPGAVDGPRHDAVRRADQRARPRAGRRRARRDEGRSPPRA